MVDRKKLKYEASDLAVLSQEIAAPTLGGIRSTISTWPTAGMTPDRLARILRDAYNGSADAYFDMAEELEEKYPHYLGVMNTRKLAVTQLPITVLAAGDDERAQKDADLARTVVESQAVEDALYDIMDALGKGLSYNEVLWDTKVVPWVPTQIIYRRPQWFELDQVDGETPRLKGGPDGTSGMPTDLPPFKFLIHRHKSKSGLTIRGGLARIVCWAWLFQNFSIKDWVTFAEIYGIPMRLGKYGPEASEDDRRALMRAVVGIANDAAGIIPRSMEVEFVNGLAAGNPEVFERLCVYLDMQVSKAVLGQTGTTDATTGGFGSSGQVHNEVRKDIQQADARTLAMTLHTLIKWVIDFNHGPPPDGRYPKVKIGAEEFFSKEDMDKIAAFVEMGGKVEASVVGDKLGLPDAPEATADGKPPKLLKPRSGGAQVAANDPSQDAPQNFGPQSGGQPPAAIDGAKTDASPPNPRLRRLNSVLETGATPLSAKMPDKPVPAAVDTRSPTDAIDAMVDDMEGDWRPVMAPMIDGLDAIVAGASSYEEMLAGVEALANVDPKKLTELLARSLFNARLAGEAGVKLRERGNGA